MLHYYAMTMMKVWKEWRLEWSVDLYACHGQLWDGMGREIFARHNGVLQHGESALTGKSRSLFERR